MPGGIRLWRQSLPLSLWLRQRRRARDADVYLLSFPKVGRTWLRVMIGSLLAEHCGRPELASVEQGDETPRLAGVPRVKVRHDGGPHRCTPDELETDKREYAACKVLLLVRDPRDATVSNYFQVTRRERTFQGDMAAWLVEPRGSLGSMLRYYSIWARQRHVPRQLLLVRYEDLQAAPVAQMKRVADFLGLQQVDDGVLARAVEHGSFERMRAREASRPADGTPFAAGTVDDPESFKTRRGRVGGYVEYFTREQVAWLDRKVREEMDPFYGYG